MGQKIHPHGFRVGITEGWSSRWFAPKAAYAEFLTEDNLIRKYVEKQLNRQPPYAAVAAVDIERTSSEVKVILHTARPGLVIGAKGAEVDKLKDHIEDLIDRKVSINIVEIKYPDLNAQLVAAGIAEQLKKKGSFRRVIKQRCDATMNAGAKGVKIKLSGRLGGAEMARQETQIRGSIPLHTLQANVQYGFVDAVTKTGTIGVKVWVYLGRYGEEIEGKDVGDRGGRGGRGGGKRFKRG